jgi:hypothetical protein
MPSRSQVPFFIYIQLTFPSHQLKTAIKMTSSSSSKLPNSHRPLSTDASSPRPNDPLDYHNIPPSILNATTPSPKTNSPAHPSPSTGSPSPSPSPAGNSTTYHSTTFAATQKLIRINNNASHLGLAHSPYFPKSLSSYLLHQQEFGLQAALEKKAVLEHKIAELEATKGKAPHKIRPFLGSKKKQRELELSAFALALALGGTAGYGQGQGHGERGEHTDADADADGDGDGISPPIWRPSAELDAARAEWPTMAESKAHGEERIRVRGRAAGRILPLPRRRAVLVVDPDTGETERVPGPVVRFSPLDFVAPDVEKGPDFFYDKPLPHPYFDTRAWSRGALGEGDEHADPPAGGWVFDEEHLRAAGVNVEVFDGIRK